MQVSFTCYKSNIEICTIVMHICDTREPLTSCSSTDNYLSLLRLPESNSLLLDSILMRKFDTVSNKEMKLMRTIFFMKNINKNMKQPSRGVLRKRCSENMQRIYKRTPMSKCDFNKVAKQSNFIEITIRHGCSPEFAAYFQNIFS